LVFDFDGVFTDNSVYLNEEGEEFVRCSRGDGMGLDLVRKHLKIPMVVISKEQNKVVAARCRKLKLDCYHGVDEKLSLLKKIVEEYKTSLDKTVFVGNDVNDKECIMAAGLGVVVSDAHDSVKDCADFTLKSAGGKGAIRELCDLFLEEAGFYK